MRAGWVGQAPLSRRPAGHRGLGLSPAPHLGLEPGRSGKAAAVLVPHGPKAPRWQGCDLEASAPRLGPGQDWLPGPAQRAQAVEEAANSALETGLERCFPGLRRSPQISATTCGGEKEEAELRAKAREQVQKGVTEVWKRRWPERR